MNGPRRTIAAVDVPTPVLESELLARRLRQDPLEALRTSLPLDDPDRHALDLVDGFFAADAAAHPEHVNEGESRTECREIQTAAYTARHVGQHLMDTGGSVSVDHSMVLAVALLLNDVAAVHWPGGGECVWDDESWPCTDVKRAHEVAQLVNALWPWAVAAAGERS